LDVLVEWEGENSDADLLDRTWRINGSAGHVAYIVTIGSYLSADLHDKRTRGSQKRRGCILVRARCRLRVAVGARGGLNGGRGAANVTQRHTQVSESERHVAGSPLG